MPHNEIPYGMNCFKTTRTDYKSDVVEGEGVMTPNRSIDFKVNTFQKNQLSGKMWLQKVDETSKFKQSLPREIEFKILPFQRSYHGRIQSFANRENNSDQNCLPSIK